MPYVTIPSTFPFIRPSESPVETASAALYSQQPPLAGYPVNDPMMMGVQASHHPMRMSMQPIPQMQPMQPYPQPVHIMPSAQVPRFIPQPPIYNAGQQLVLVPDGYTPIMIPNPQPTIAYPGPQLAYQPYYPSPKPRPSGPKRIPRPPNSFMTYRMEKQHEVMAKHEGVNNKDISVIIGEMWRNESAQVKEYYRQKAEMGRKNHMLKYPDYKYTPLKKRNQALAKKVHSASVDEDNSTISDSRKPAESSQPSLEGSGPRSAADRRSFDSSVASPEPATTPDVGKSKTVDVQTSPPAGQAATGFGGKGTQADEIFHADCFQSALHAANFSKEFLRGTPSLYSQAADASVSGTVSGELFNGSL